jgi:purine-binding chemotaxis protein CheW
MTTLYLIARIGSETVALPATEVGSVVEVDQIAPVPRVPPHVAGLFALRSRVLTVIDTRAALGLGAMDRAGRIMTAIIAECDGHSYALLVDEVEDVIEGAAPEPCPALLGPGWRRAAKGTVRHGEDAILLVDPTVLIAGPEAVAA